MYVFLDSSIVYCTSYEPPICFASCTVIIPGSLCLSFCLAPCISLFFALSFTCASSLSLSCPPSRSLCISLSVSLGRSSSLSLLPPLLFVSVKLWLILALTLSCSWCWFRLFCYAPNPSHSRVLCSPLVHCISLDLSRALYGSCSLSFYPTLPLTEFFTLSLLLSLSLHRVRASALALSFSRSPFLTHARTHTHTHA